MSRDEIIAMAREAGFTVADHATVEAIGRFARFAALVAAAEREACAQVCEKYGTSVTTKDCAAAIRARGTP